MNLEEARAQRKARREQKKSKRTADTAIKGPLNKAYAHHKANQFAEAVPYYQQVLEVAEERADIHNNLGLALKELERWDEAIAHYRRAIEIDPDDPTFHNNLGNALSQFGQKHEAVACYRRAVALKPEFDQFLSNLGVALQDIAAFEEAEEIFRKIIEMNPRFGSAYSNLASAQNAQGRWQEALVNFKMRFDLERGDDPILPNHRSFLTVSKPKIDHDIEQFRYLHDLGRTDQPFDKLAELYEAVRDETEWPTGEGNTLVPLTPDQRRRIGATYNRSLYLVDAPALAQSPINQDLDSDTITQAYFEGADGCREVATVDNLLTQEALTSLRHFLQESTIWYDIYRRGYLGAYFGEGLECGLLLQIAEGLRLKFPDIFKDHKLNQIWANKYDSQLTGIGLHADFAAVNINFWITPDEANLGDNNGGLVVYGQEAPLGWSFESYNRNEEKIQDYLESHASARTVIPYRCNRMGIFNSDLFHKTDTIDFKTGYENRRMNVTMLFGTRQTAH